MSQRNASSRPEKRLLIPGLLNRLIFHQRALSDSDLQRKEYCIHETDHPAHVYHANTINEHSVEVNLVNTYGSESELHVWSHDCAEQRRFVHERRQQFTHEMQDTHSHQQLALERQLLLQQIYEYPWLLHEKDLDQADLSLMAKDEQTLLSPTSDVVVPSHNPDFYQLCSLTHSSSFVISHGTSSAYPMAPKT